MEATFASLSHYHFNKFIFSSVHFNVCTSVRIRCVIVGLKFKSILISGTALNLVSRVIFFFLKIKILFQFSSWQFLTTLFAIGI